MAYSASNLATNVASNGIGGFLVYATDDDNLSVVIADGYITSTFAQDFVKHQGIKIGDDWHCPILIRAKDAMEWREIYYDTSDTSLKIVTTAAFIIT